MTKLSAVWFSIVGAGFLALAPASGESPAVLVKDLAPGSAQGVILPLSGAFAFGGEAYFTADDGFVGNELWATDGTRRGTHLVADLCPGRCGGEPRAFTPSGSLLFFVAGNTTSGESSFWLWRSDGTDDGTYPLADLAIDAIGSPLPLGYLLPLRGGVVFILRDGVRRGYDLWRSDGTRAGTRKVLALPGDGLDAPFNRPLPSLSQPGAVHFNWQGVSWVTDGTARGTHPVADLPITRCDPGEWIELDHRLIYAGMDEAKGCEPWVTDGTREGTHRLRDLNPGAGGSFPFGLVSTRTGVYFTATDRLGRSRLWKTDGTTPGTVRVRTPRPERPLNRASIFGADGSRVYFAADDGVHGVELWKTDGNPATTQLVADLTPGSGGTQIDYGFAVGDSLYFFAHVGGSDDILWHTDGTAASTVRFHGVTTLLGFTAFRDRVFFTIEVPGGGSALAENDGTADGTRILFHAEPAISSSPTALTSTARGLLFSAGETLSGHQLWESDGRRSGTRLLASYPALDPAPRLFGSRDGVFISLFYFQPGNVVLWSDGGPEPPRALVPEPGLEPATGFVETGAGTAFFLGHGIFGDGALELWGSDGTPSGTGPLAVVDEGPNAFDVFVTPGPEPGTATFLYQVPTSTIARASALFTTDGTAGGTRQLADLGIENNEVQGIVATTDLSYLVLEKRGGEGVAASRLLATDGTREGTREVFRIDKPFDRSFISETVPVGNVLYFTGHDDATGRELWATDGSSGGTARVADLAPGRSSSSPSDLFVFHDRVFFAADDGKEGRELWVTDGSVEGTRQIEIRPGPRGSFPQGFTAVGDHVVFAADDGVHGLELWQSDGTKAGTRLVADVMPGRLGSDPVGFASFGSDLFFSAGKPNIGYELFRVPRSVLDPGQKSQRDLR